MRSRRETVHFRHPFRIKGIDRELAPGAYEIVTDEEMIEGLSFPCFRRVATLIMVRLGHKRSLARKTAFDAVLIVILASVLSRAINGSSAFFATLGGGLVIVALHRLFASAAYHWHWFGFLIKGSPELIVRDGKMLRDVMRRNHVSEHDLEEDLRLDAQMEDASKVKIARVERSGDISFIKKE